MSYQTYSWESNLLSRAMESDESVHLSEVTDIGRLHNAYTLCNNLTRHHSKSFYWASALLPFAKRQAIRALYAFCRLSDDIVDIGDNNKAHALALWRHKALAPHALPDDPVLLAWHDVRQRYRVPPRYMRQLLDGVARDLTPTHYATFADFADYAYGVASTVGLMSMYIIGYRSEEAIPYAIRLGVALQMTNVLRDVGADWQMGRLYLPQDELSAFGVSAETLAAGRVTPAWRELMRWQIARNRQLYAEAEPGIALLDPDGQFAIAAAARLYAAILQDIERNDYDVFSRRAFVSGWGKVRQLARLL